MPIEVKLPNLGQDSVEATITSVVVKVDDCVEKGDVLCEIESDKAAIDVPSPAKGVVKHIFVRAGQTVSANSPLMLLGEADEQITQAMIDSHCQQPQKSVSSKTSVADTDSTLINESALPQGNEKAVDIYGCKLGDTVPLSRLQKITGRKMLFSKQNIPCFYLNIEVDVTDLVELRGKINQAGGAKVSYNDFIIKAAAAGLEHFPVMAGQIAGDAIAIPECLGVAFAVEGAAGLVTPVVKDAGKMTVTEVAKVTAGLIEKAKSNKLGVDDLTGAVMTISNLGAFEIESFVPIVVPGQCSILGIGKIGETAVPTNSHITVRKIIKLTIAADHRIANGAYAAQFLDFLKKFLEDVSNFPQE